MYHFPIMLSLPHLRSCNLLQHAFFITCYILCHVRNINWYSKWSNCVTSPTCQMFLPCIQSCHHFYSPIDKMAAIQ